jgi:hypothetical protein
VWRRTHSGWQRRLGKRKAERDREEGRRGFGRLGQWWVVEDILDVRRVGRRTEWLVRWAGVNVDGSRMWPDEWRNRSTAAFDTRCWRIAKQLELFVYPKQRRFIRRQDMLARGRLTDQRAQREGLLRTRRGWIDVAPQMDEELEDQEAEGVVHDIGVGGYRRERIVGGKWRRAARRTWLRAEEDTEEEDEADAV